MNVLIAMHMFMIMKMKIFVVMNVLMNLKKEK